jgi:hypothetical protein
MTPLFLSFRGALLGASLESIRPYDTWEKWIPGLVLRTIPE